MMVARSLRTPPSPEEAGLTGRRSFGPENDGQTGASSSEDHKPAALPLIAVWESFCCARIMAWKSRLRWNLRVL